MGILYFLESIRMPGLNEFMLLITKLGEETAFLAAALIVFWCVNKRSGYYLMTVGFMTTMFNQILKLLCRVPRPWVLDENFTILEQAREAASGYSFPSGHSQSAVGTFGCLAVTAQKKWLRYVCVFVAVMVPVSRMYVGVHTPADVLVGAGISLLLVLILRPLAFEGSEKRMNYALLALLGLAAAFMLFVNLWPFPEDVDPHNLASGVKNAYTMLGCIPGVVLVYCLERKYVNFTTDACWWAQILKAVLGLAAVLAVKEGLRAPLEMVFSVYVARSVRYFLIVITAGLLWPMTFRWFSKLGGRK